MKRGLYFNLAFNNIRKNKNTFFPFLIASIAMIAMFYMLLSICLQSDGLYYGAEYMSQILYLGVWVTGIVSVIIIFYTNSFLMKQRTKELGLYNILGLEKKHIGYVLFWEIMLVALTGMVVGLALGIIFSKLLFLILVKMLDLKAKLGFTISLRAVLCTVGLFAIVYLLDILGNRLRIVRLKPVDMMRETNAGEREPKAKWIMALVGVMCLGVAYYFAVTTKNPLEAMNTFFVAVLLVIVGTYFIFVAGSIALLKILKKNKKFYYHKTHFVTVSGMMYRMKQNAMGLASICILATMVIVVLSTTVSLYVGTDDEQRNRYPKDVTIGIDYQETTDAKVSSINQQIKKTAQTYAKKKNVSVHAVESYAEFELTMVKTGNHLSVYKEGENLDGSTTVFNVMTEKDYNKKAKEDVQIQNGKPILLTNEDGELKGNTLDIAGKKVTVKKGGLVDESLDNGYCAEMFLILSDFDKMVEYKDYIASQKPRYSAKVNLYYNFDLKGKVADKEAYGKGIKKILRKNKVENLDIVEDYYSTRQTSLGLYASVFFIGIFLGALFIAVTVLIIYYKQISEGYDDRRNFQIMKKIGLAKSEINHIINSQIRMVFLLPILAAVVHICFSFPIIRQIMSMMNLTNTKLFICCTVGTVFVFLLIYMLVYKITSRVYYHIVGQH